MIQREMPDTIVYVCSDCGEETEHQILKGRMGKATLEGTFRCNECGKVTSETIRIPEIITVPVIYSDGDVSEPTSTTLESNDLVQIISSGLGPQSSIVSVETGTVTNGTVSGRIEDVTGSNLSAFIYLGGYYPVYSKLFWL